MQRALQRVRRRDQARAAELALARTRPLQLPRPFFEHIYRCGVLPICRATEAFLIAAYEQNIVGLRTNTPFGFGEFLRVSLYNGTSVEDAELLAAFMRRFAKSYSNMVQRLGSPEGLP